MAWVRLDDTFPEHPKVAKVGGDAAWLHVCALAYCNRHTTDGHIPDVMIGRLSDRKNAEKLAGALVAIGLWDEADDGWVIHDYLDFQPSKEETDERRAKRAESGRQGGIASGEARRSKREANAKQLASTDEASCFDADEANTNPDPTRPVDVKKDNDFKSSASPASSSSPSFARQVSEAAARLLAERTGGIGNIEAWVNATSRKLYTEREDRIRQAHARGLSVAAAAEFVLTDPAPHAPTVDMLRSAREYGAAVKAQHVAGEYADMPDLNREAFLSELQCRDEDEEWHNAAIHAYDEYAQKPNLRAV